MEGFSAIIEHGTHQNRYNTVFLVRVVFSKLLALSGGSVLCSALNLVGFWRCFTAYYSIRHP